MSRQHILDNLTERAHSLAQSSPVAKVNKFVDEAKNKYTKLCGQSKDMMEKFEVAVKDHQQYQDAYQDCHDWLNSSREKVIACADTSGDRVSIQNKLERLRVCKDTSAFKYYTVKPKKSVNFLKSRNIDMPKGD